MSNEFDPQNALTTAKRFLTGKLLSSGLNGYVIGLSGGIDSAVSAAIAVSAVGAGKVFGVLMPYKSSSEASVKDANELVQTLGIESRTVDISPMIDAYYPEITDQLLLRAGNKMARERMSILFDIAAEKNSLVLGTGNRSEAALGYTTWFGDSACSVNPLGEMYKNEVNQLARLLEVPDSILSKAPSADLWVNQTDEKEIGVTYETIDSLLKLIIDQGETSMAALAAKGFDQTDISRVVSLVNSNFFKRTLPAVAPLGRTPIPDHIELKE